MDKQQAKNFLKYFLHGYAFLGGLALLFVSIVGIATLIGNYPLFFIPIAFIMAALAIGYLLVED